MRWPPPPEPLEGGLIRLEPITGAHRDALREAARAPEIWTWIDPRMSADDEAFAAWFDQRLRASQEGWQWCFVTLPADGGQPIGSSSYINVWPQHRSLECGWTWLNPAAWRTGANIETRLLMWGYAFEVLGCSRIGFMTDVENRRVRSSLEATGARLEGVFRKHLLTDAGGHRDSAYYGVIDDDWPEVRAGLERRLARHVKGGVARA